MLQLAALIPGLRDTPVVPLRRVTPDEAARPFGLAATALVRVHLGGVVDDVALETRLPGAFASYEIARLRRVTADVDAAFDSVTTPRGSAAGYVIEEEVRIVDALGRTVLDAIEASAAWPARPRTAAVHSGKAPVAGSTRAPAGTHRASPSALDRSAPEDPAAR